MEYEKLGLKSGLEIHQQLDCGKLFSRTPSFLRKDEPDYEIKRKFHKIAGETGEIDEAVEFEASVEKEFIYQGYHDSISLVELDEEPPQEINKEALREALKIALLLNCEIYQITQIMRKTVIDGSNTSGFQRTLLIAHNGFVETNFGKVGIESVCLEEDAARIIEKSDKKVIFRLDRLGIPLVEIATKPDLRSAEQIKECALKIGEILRACNVKRGIGTIRQDLNISIKGHEKVEIKGFQDPKIMIDVVNMEIERQLNNLKKKKKKGEVRNALPNAKTEFLRPLPGRARMYPETDLPLLRISKQMIDDVRKSLPRLREEIRKELKKKGMHDELINLILSSKENLDELRILMKVYNKDANLIGKMITLWRREIASRTDKGILEIKEILTERVLERILEEVSKGNLEKEYVKETMYNIVEGKDIENALKNEKKSNDELEEEIRKIVKEKPGLTPNAYMGIIMKKMRGEINPKKAMDILKRILKK